MNTPIIDMNRLSRVFKKGEKIKPDLSGVYKVKRGRFDAKNCHWWAYYDKETDTWGPRMRTIDAANATRTDPEAVQNKSWQGLTYDPYAEAATKGTRA